MKLSRLKYRTQDAAMLVGIGLVLTPVVAVGSLAVLGLFGYLAVQRVRGV